MERGKSQPRRCAIYTRKSSEEGLEQDFNSLHAQREACEAFIKSQHGEGWRLVKAAYDDGGFSGRTMERPALQRLLADIRERVIADFAKMVELFDAPGRRRWLRSPAARAQLIPTLLASSGWRFSRRKSSRRLPSVENWPI